MVDHVSHNEFWVVVDYFATVANTLLIFLVTDFCDYPLILIVGVPHDDAGYTASIFSDIRKYLKARVKTHLKCNPNGWIGIEKFANAQWLACPMSSDADELLNCIDGIPSARMHSLPHAGFSMPQDTKENSIGLMPAVAHALTAVEHWYFYELDRIRFPDVLDLWVMEGVRQPLPHEQTRGGMVWVRFAI